MAGFFPPFCQLHNVVLQHCRSLLVSRDSRSSSHSCIPHTTFIRKTMKSGMGWKYWEILSPSVRSHEMVIWGGCNLIRWIKSAWDKRLSTFNPELLTKEKNPWHWQLWEPTYRLALLFHHKWDGWWIGSCFDGVKGKSSRVWSPWDTQSFGKPASQ